MPSLLSGRCRFWLWGAMVAFAIKPLPLQAEDAPSALRLTLPPQVYAVAGSPFQIFPENLILTQTPEKHRYRFQLQREGKPVAAETFENRRWTFEPTASHVGRWSLRVTVRDADEKSLADAETTLIVSPADAGKDRKISLLIVGDSLTHATIYPNELAKLLSQPGNPKWTMLGTHRPASAAPGVAHEGYGGWTWQAFASRYAAPPTDDGGRRVSSPFVFADDNGSPQLDAARYFETHCQGQRPDIVTFLLGINDCFSAPPDDLQRMDQQIDAVFAQAETVLAAMRKAAPDAAMAICLTPPPNVREEAFEANYKGRYPRWGWRRIQHRLVERQLKHFGGREKERIFVVPTELNVDPVDGYPPNNGVHPNETGYRQIAQCLHAWLKWKLSLSE